MGNALIVDIKGGIEDLLRRGARAGERDHQRQRADLFSHICSPVGTAVRRGDPRSGHNVCPSLA